jgi:hypothetical protein
VLKLTAVLQPVGDQDPQRVDLQVTRPAAAWRTVGSSRIGGASPRPSGCSPGTPAVPRTPGALRRGHRPGAGVDRDRPEGPGPDGRACVAMVNCTIHTGQPFDAPSSGRPRLPGGQDVGCTPENLYFLHRAGPPPDPARPDLLVASGDRLRATWRRCRGRRRRHPGARRALPLLPGCSLPRVTGPRPAWSGGRPRRAAGQPLRLVRRAHPAAGRGGRRATRGGGERRPGGAVRAQPRPVGPPAGAPGNHRVLRAPALGRDQLRPAGGPQVQEQQPVRPAGRRRAVRRATPAARPTAGGLPARLGRPRPGPAAHRAGPDPVGRGDHHPQGEPFADSDNNGAVPGARRARGAGQGRGRDHPVRDTHLASLVRQGIDTFTDGPVQFTGPAAGRCGSAGSPPPGHWKRRADAVHGGLDRRLGQPDAGARRGNPKVGYAPSSGARTRRGTKLADRSLKRRGYGIVRVEADRPGTCSSAGTGGPTATGPQGTVPGWPTSCRSRRSEAPVGWGPFPDGQRRRHAGRLHRADYPYPSAEEIT